MKYKLKWRIVRRWHDQIFHEAVTDRGKYSIRTVRCSHHYRVLFTATNGEWVDVGHDEPWNLKHCKRQCEAHLDLGSPVPCDYRALFDRYDILYPRKRNDHEAVQTENANVSAL